MTRVVTEEYEALRHGAGLIEASILGVVRAGGPDRAAFLHNLLTQDIQGLAPGSAAMAALVTPAGKLITDLIVWARAEAHWLLAPRSRVEALMQGLEHYLITEDVTLEDRTASQTVLALQGPASQKLFSGLQASAVPYSITGSPGLLIMATAEGSGRLQQELLTRGAKRVGLDTFNVARIEAGIPWYGIDMDESNLLPETGLQARAVSRTKGCYVGQEIIARMDTFGSASRKLMGLIVEGSEVPQPGDAILTEVEPVGAVTSSCFSPALNKPIALGYVKRPHYEPGARVTVLRGSQPIPAILAQLPFREVSDTFGVKSV